MAYAYYNPNPPASGILCTFSDNYDNIIFPHFHIGYELTLILSGTHKLILEQNSHTMRTGDLFLLRPNEIHTRAMETASGKYINLAFAAPEIYRLAAYLGEGVPMKNLLQKAPPMVHLGSSEMELQRRRIERINLFCDTSPDVAMAELRALLVDLCFHYLAAPALDTSMHPPWFTKLLLEMQRPENMRRGLPAMLELTPYSHEYLCREFKRMLGCTPTEYLNNIRMVKARQLIESQEMDILNICYFVGFESVSYFYRLYKSKFGNPPSRDRKIRRLTRPAIPEEQRSDLSE